MAPNSNVAVILLILTVFHRSYARDNSTSELAKATNFLVPKNCADPALKNLPSGVHRIQPQPGMTTSFEVYCDQKFDKGGWTVFQNRFDGSVNFYRGWQQYEDGFGDLKKEFWLGLRKLNQLTYSGKFELAIVMSDWDDITAVARYSHISVAGAEEDYMLNSLGDYSGTAGDSLTWGVGMKWSTLDRENDISPTENCAVDYKGAWWYTGCHYSNLNGLYLKGAVPDFATMMCWKAFRGHNYGLKTSRMMIRPVA